MIYVVTNQKSIAELPEGFEYSTVEESLEYLNSITWIGVDTETTGFDPYSCELLTLQLGDYHRQYVIDMSNVNISNYKSLLESKEKVFLLQNAKFDLRFMLHNDIHVNVVRDTFLMENLLFAGFDREEIASGLDSLAKKYAGAFLDKSVRASIHRQGLTTKVIKYAAEDVKYLEIIFKEQWKKIEEYDMVNVANLENEVVKVFAAMEYTGVLVDRNNWLEVSVEVNKEKAILTQELENIVLADSKLSKYVPKYIQTDIFGENKIDLGINWASAKQKLEILKSLGLDVESTGDAILQKNKKKHLIIPKLIDYNRTNKLSTSFGEAFLKKINKISGRVHPDYWQILSTGRISVKDPNVNQIPSKGDVAKRIRASFIARPGYKIVGGDYSGMELRIIAEFSKDPTWVNTFKEGGDLHSVLCSMTFGIPIEDVKKPFPEKPTMSYRDVQKTINFGLAYGMSEFKLADTMQISTKEAKKIIEKFFSVVPDVEKFLNLLGKTGIKKGRIRTAKPYRRIRFFPKWEIARDPMNPGGFAERGNIERASKNHPIQGTNADIIKLALCKVYNTIVSEDLPVKILLSVYDEIQTECREDYAEEWKHKLDSLMISAAEEVIKEVPIVVDCSISDYWQK